MVELPGDLLEVVGSYSVPSTTYRLITLTRDLSIRTAYGQGFWRRKIIYERRGLVFDDAVVRANHATYHTYYRLINTREYGTAYLYSEGRLSGSLANGVTGLGTRSARQVVLIFSNRVTITPLSSPSSVDDRGTVEIPLPGVVECFNHPGGEWPFLTERGQIYSYEFGDDVLCGVPLPGPMVEIFVSGSGRFLGREGEIYRFRSGQREEIQHARPFVLRGGYEVIAFEANGAAITRRKIEPQDLPITVTSPSEYHGQTLLLDGDTTLLGRVTKEGIPVCRVLRDISSKLTVDGVLHGPTNNSIPGILEASSDWSVCVVLR